ncbi:hypothetical protein CDAR_74341 [Caerostris darwini]|uniref:Uncharacterized protein n=1 Tax=Caerostris darwini TaxID=1538125 RepID=A0AAV4UJW3_9ARAC|nr:hypothetical protein CDAR_74341 [Caerostris darwini]
MDVTAVHMIPIKKLQQPGQRAALYSEHFHSTSTSLAVWSKTKLFMQWNTLRLAPADSPMCWIQCYWNRTGSACCIEIYGNDLALHDPLLFWISR